MPCYKLQIAFPVPGKTRTGKQAYLFAGKLSTYLLEGTFKKKKRPLPEGFKLLPCKKCIGCRLEKSRQWATRLIHETSFHKSAVFLTLTYDQKNIPIDGSLKKEHLRTFFNDLRGRNSYYGKDKIKYFACGEYGDQTGRPHYHAVLFGDIGLYDAESSPARPSRSGNPQYSNSRLSEVWTFGEHTISEHNFETAAYVARYILKKISGAPSAAHYGDRIPEFQSSSNGLGKGHAEKWLGDIYPSDHVVLPGRGEFMPPPYYDRVLEKIDPALFARVKQKRQEAQEPLTSRDDLVEVFTERLMVEEVRTIITDETLKRLGVV